MAAGTVSTVSIPYGELKNAVFYSQQKPELLADIIADAIGVKKPNETETE